MEFIEISSRQNRIIIDCGKLLDRKYRESSRLFRTDGIKLFEEAARFSADFEYIVVNESKKDDIVNRLTAYKLPESTRVYVVPESCFSKISEEKSPDGIICVIKHIDKFHKFVTIDNIPDICRGYAGGILLLESVRDPGNLGTIIRSAAAFGIKKIIMSSDCADIYNPKTLRGAMGAMFCTEIYTVRDIAEAIMTLRGCCGRMVYAAALDRDAKRLGSFKPGESDCAVIGNEGHGLSEKTIAACSDRLFIPITGGAESLNASAAAAVILWEMRNLG